MWIASFLVQTLVVAVALAVVVSYVIRRYEVENGDPAERNGEFSALERALGIGGEIGAALLCLVLYPFGYVAAESSGTLTPGQRPLILCHGYNHNRSAFLLMRWRLKKAGRDNVVIPNFRPASATVPAFAEQLSEKVKLAMAQSGCEKVDLVGHSMGGLVVRYFMEHLGGASSVGAAVTLGAPHKGTKMAALGLFSASRQFRPDSSLTQQLCRSTHGSADMVAIWSEFDNIILPPENATLPCPCKNLMVRNLGHIALLFSGQVLEQLQLALSRSAQDRECQTIYSKNGC